MDSNGNLNNHGDTVPSIEEPFEEGLFFDEGVTTIPRGSRDKAKILVSKCHASDKG